MRWSLEGRAITGAPVETASTAGLAAKSSDDAVRIEALVRRFGERTALTGINASVGGDETLALFGPNGAGKTTLLRVLAGLLLPHAGSVRVLGHDLPRDAHAIRSQLGFLGHEPLLYRELSGRENLAFYARLYGVADYERRIAGLLDATGMTRRADEPLRTLSRGMVQRLAVCRAVLHRPTLLLLDEPRSGLDPDAVELVEPLIGRSSGCTRVLVTHDVERGLDEADRVIGLRSGRVALEAAARNVTGNQIRDLYRGAT